MEIMKRIGCRPPYWDVQATIPNCTSNDQLRQLGRLIIVLSVNLGKNI
jgi:hypothetical protein